MRIDLTQKIKTVYGNVLKKQSVEFMEAQAKYGQIYGPNWFEKIPVAEQEDLKSKLGLEMDLGYLIVESLPKALGEKPSQEEGLKVGRLQRRVVKNGVQDFTVEEVAQMKKAVCAFLIEREMVAVADIVCEMLEAQPEASQAEESAR